MNINFFLNISIKSIEVLFSITTIYVAGWGIGLIPLFHIFAVQQFYKSIQLFYQELDKFKKFRGFLRNVNNDYPLVIPGDGVELEDCAICKEVMNQARRLPCNHCFHWFCII
jgi:hypothetical protein